MVANHLEIFCADPNASLILPYVDHGVRAGFPSPSQDYIEAGIDLNKLLIKHPASTFYARVRGDSMVDADICDGDILVVDKSLTPKSGDLAVCCLAGEFTLKHIDIRENEVWLIPANEEYDPIHVDPEDDFTVWGVVTYSIKKHRDCKRK